MFSQQNSTQNTIGIGSVAQKGNHSIALTVNSSKLWIVDSGASDHMTGDVSLFHKYTPTQENSTIKTADGSLSNYWNSKLTREHNCVAKFSANLCEFQDLISGRTIGNTKEDSGLFFLKETSKYQPRKTPYSLIHHFEIEPFQNQNHSKPSQQNSTPITLSQPELCPEVECQTLPTTKELHVYSRRPKPDEGKERQLSYQNHKSNPDQVQDSPADFTTKIQYHQVFQGILTMISDFKLESEMPMPYHQPRC
ncbi:hypothetical protein ACH5RR_009920 [Cinchona calisaya]|uniref:Retrovirus-related Pol polyprotein from transposon TNT 1-94-like beta-barrel domain-containing protein n=1 Tax=Cinchona calisaya TaxID=153742 RepID=A0ABD3AII8_9GENT